MSGTVTRKQFLAAIFTALLSPLLRMLPRAAVLSAGRSAWLCIVPAAPVLLALAALLNALRARLRPGEGMANLILRVFGPVIGRVFLALSAAWFLLYAGFVLRSGAERLTATVYLRSEVSPFMLVMLALCLPAALGTLRATARTGVVLRALLFGALLLGTAFSLPQLTLRNLALPSPQELPGILFGAWPVVTVGGVAALFSFLSAYVGPSERPMRQLVGPLALFLGAVSLLCFAAVGTFGAALTTRLSFPFFTMVRDITIGGVAPRVEAIVIALWVFADYLLCVLLLRCAHEALRTIFGLPKGETLPTFDLRRGRWLFPVEAAAVFFCAHFMASSAAQMRFWSETAAPCFMDLFVYGGGVLLWLAARVRKIPKNEK